MSNETETEPERQSIRLDHFLKMATVAKTGGHAKLLIQGGEVIVNGEVETRRRRKLFAGDVVVFDGEDYVLEETDDDE